jgi:hypothetical protein
MPFQRPLFILAAAGLMLAAAGCSHVTPLGPGSAPASPPPARDLGSPITMQVMRSRLPTQAGQCPAGSVDLFGSEPDVPRASAVTVQQVPGSTAPPATPPPPGAGVACYVPVGAPVTVTSAAVSAVTSYPHQAGPTAYGFVVAFPQADIAALTAVIRQAYDSGDALGMSVAGKLWQAPQTRQKINALRAEQINLLSQEQAMQLYRLLVPSS